MSRRLIVVLAYVLLLAMQDEGARHGVEHLRAEIAQAHRQALSLPSLPCDECALLAGAAHVLLDDGAAAGPPVPALFAPALPAETVAIPAPRYYAARAPPLRS